MRVLGIETSCDETGVAVYDTGRRPARPRAALAGRRCTRAYGGVVPELASRDHVRRLVPLIEAGAGRSRHARSPTSTASPTPRAPGSPARCWSARASPTRSAYALGKPAIGIHHLEGHLLSPLLADPRPDVPVRRAAGVRRPHASSSRSTAVGPLPAARRHARRRRRRGVRQDREAARPAVSGRAGARAPRRVRSRRRGAAAAADARLRRSRHELLGTQDRRADAGAAARARRRAATRSAKADIAREFQAAVVDVLVAKSIAALDADRRVRGSSSPAASARTGSCARGSRARSARAARASTSRTSRSAPTTAR